MHRIILLEESSTPGRAVEFTVFINTTELFCSHFHPVFLIQGLLGRLLQGVR
jgi:hypothetical protein